MAYATINFRTKKALREAVKAGKQVTVFQPGGLFENPKPGTTVALEGPHYPEAHRWYATARLDHDGNVVSVK